MASRSREAIVVDASVAAKWHLTDEEHSDAALRLIERYVSGEIELVAPKQIHYEVPSAITAATLGPRPRLLPVQGRQAIEEFLALGVTTIGDSDLVVSAYDLVHRFRCAFYDALYVALSRRLAIPFVTADLKLYKLIRDLPDVVWIGDYSNHA